MNLLDELKKIGSALVCPTPADVESARTRLAHVCRYLMEKDFTSKELDILAERGAAVGNRFVAHELITVGEQYVAMRGLASMALYTLAEVLPFESEFDSNGNA